MRVLFVVFTLFMFIGCDNESQSPLLLMYPQSVQTTDLTEPILSGKDCDIIGDWCEGSGQYRCVDGTVKKVGECATVNIQIQ